ncbi:hypothetical protein M409DRAFT_23453 [Zasmidium cellare ATCC 36951]|uniref:Heterokaryon incompatibility domain-containing protein n=1 Tax=Zasmidium cellare ATCC 36951 TaxID=1080233 RepID=A0A6A6CGS3_ZASCE|nr:uncharacterized protein M409DRAFT_23453 [Zasmidium cellare ATCC 36951]KAF2166261.1 hypothetical protein M409DRAFT_23453 [Zasmidium cellare ATCC 36951]
MDHIADENGQRLKLRIPYTAKGLQYDGKGWGTFPERAGYPWLVGLVTVQDMNDHFSQEAEADLQAFAQAWMYFGVLKEVLKNAYREEDYILAGEDDGTAFLTTKGTRQWQYNGEDYGGPLDVGKLRGQEKIDLGQAATTLKEALKMSELWDRFAIGKRPLWAELLLSFKLVIELLACVPLGMPRKTEFLGDLNLTAKSGPAADLVRSSLLKDNKVWCWHQVDALCTTVSYSTLVYLTGLTRWDRGLDHSQCLETNHCIAYNIAVGDDFHTAHVEKECKCQHVEASRSERVQILERGGIPVLECEESKTENLQLRFVAASPHVDYTAISHLWADGLGNPFGNTLPRCQLMRLIEIVRATNESELSFWSWFPRTTPVRIWLDIYCVPAQVSSTEQGHDRRSPEEQQQDVRPKRMAIARMDVTYAWASYVLALDQELIHSIERGGSESAQQSKSSAREHDPNRTNMKTTAYMAISAWNTRCWTFQEHVLARRTILQGLHAQVQYSETLEGYLTDRGIQLDFHRMLSRQAVISGVPSSERLLRTRTLWFALLVSWLFLLRSRRTKRKTPLKITTTDNQFSRAWNCFYGRTTTQWEDMIVVLTNLMDLSAGHVLQLGSGAQMKSLLSTQQSLPLSLLLVEM